MTAWQSGSVVVDGLRFHYTRTGGAKPPLVLAHGFSDDGLCWTRLAEALADRYDIVMVDACGHGRSDERAQPYGPIEQAADLAGVITQLGLVRPLILGHSMGAVTALVLAGTAPELPRAILLEDPPVLWAPPPPELSGDGADQPSMHSWFLALKRKTREELITEERLRSPGWDAAEFEPWADSKLRASPNLLMGWDARAMARVDWVATLQRITCPALLIRADGIITPASAASLQELVPQLQSVYIPQAGHSIRRDQFAAYLAAVRAFLAALP